MKKEISAQSLNANPLNWFLTRTTPLQLRDERQGKIPKASPITPEQIEIRELKKKLQRIEMETVPANSVKNAFCNVLFYLVNRNGLLHIKINTIGQNTSDDSRQLIRQCNRGFQEPSTGLQPLQPDTQTVIALFHTAHYRPRTMNNESSQTPVAIFRYRRQTLFSTRTVLAGNQSTPRR